MPRRIQQLRGLAAAGAVVVLGLAVCSAVIAGMTAGAAPRRVVLASLDEGEEKVRRAVGSAIVPPTYCPPSGQRPCAARRARHSGESFPMPCSPPPLS
jgi:hypothetical protein